jgi:hypothetical protein
VEQGLRFYEALVKAGVPAEAHIFANGPARHRPGQGRCGSGPVANLLEIWLRAQGLLTVDKPPSRGAQEKAIAQDIAAEE